VGRGAQHLGALGGQRGRRARRSAPGGRSGMSMPVSNVDELILGKGARLEELVDRQALGELARGFAELYGMGVRIFDAQGKLTAEAGSDGPLFDYLRTLRAARRVLEDSALAIKSLEPGSSGEAELGCPSGGRYAVFAVESDSRRVGRVIIGPYFPPDLAGVPAELCEGDEEIDPNHAARIL